MSKKPDVRKNEPTIHGIGYHEARFDVKIFVDDKSSLVEIYDRENDQEDPVGVGTARRRRGDRRSSPLGVALAMARAFEDASNEYAKVAQGLLDGKLPK